MGGRRQGYLLLPGKHVRVNNRACQAWGLEPGKVRRPGQLGQE